MFTLHDVAVRYGPVLAVGVPDWSADRGSAWLLAGPSGSGKSTVLHLLAGLLTAQRGSVLVDGTDLAMMSESARDRWRGQTVGLVPQRLHLIGAVSVRDNLRLAQAMAGRAVDDARIDALLEAVGVRELALRLPRQLSHGQAQRVAIARSVVNRPVLLLADEPTANLDDTHAAAALDLLHEQAKATGATLVVASHDARVRPLLPNTYQMPGLATPVPA